MASIPSFYHDEDLGRLETGGSEHRLMANIEQLQYDDYTKTPSSSQTFCAANLKDATSHKAWPLTGSFLNLVKRVWLYATKPFNSQTAKPEKRKAAITRSFWKLAKSLLIHIFAVVVTVVVILPSFRNSYWFDEGSWQDAVGLIYLLFDQNEVLNALQYAAKAHEVLMVTSLSAIFLDFWRTRLLGSQGLPFGLLATAYSATSVDAFFKKRIFSSLFRSWRDFFFVLCLICTVILGNTVGPSSAIVILPNLDWWSYDNPFGGKQISAYITIPPDEVYATHLKAPNNSDFDICFTADYTDSCPGGSFGDLNAWAQAYALENAPSNITMVEPLGNTLRVLAVGAAATATTLHQSISLLTGLFWQSLSLQSALDYQSVTRPRLTPTNNSQIWEPVVQVQCNYFEHGGNSNVTYPPNTDHQTLEVDSSLYNFSYPTNATNFTFTDLAPYLPGTSLGALFTIPWIYTVGNNTTHLQGSMLLPCTINAQWSRANLSYDPSVSDIITSNLTSSPADLMLGNNSSHIVIDPAWAEMLNVPGIHSETESREILNTTMMQAFVNHFVTDVPSADGEQYRDFAVPRTTAGSLDDFGENAVSIVSTLLAAVLAEGISRSVYMISSTVLKISSTTLIHLTSSVGENQTYVYPPNEIESLLSNCTRVEFSFERYGYGYGFHYSTTVYLSIIVLLAYASAATLYMICKSGAWALGHWSKRHRGWVGSSWGDMSELVALALVTPRGNARKTLGNVGAGIEFRHTWQQTVRICEGPDHDLQLVPLESLRVEQGFNDVVVDKKYR